MPSPPNTTRAVRSRRRPKVIMRPKPSTKATRGGKDQASKGDETPTNSQEVVRKTLKGRKATPAGTWLQDPDSKVKNFSLERLPIELRYIIYEEVLRDMGPSITYVGLRYHFGLRRCTKTMGAASKESKWRWGGDVIEAIPEMRPFVERAIGAYKDIRTSPLRPVRHDKDLVVYCFERGHYHIDWRLTIDKTRSIETLGPGIQNIGVRFGCANSGGVASQPHTSVHTPCGIRAYCQKVCPDQLADFIDNFPDVKVVYLLIMLQANHLRIGQTKDNVRTLVKNLIAGAEKDGRAKFEDRSRVWVEIKQSHARTALCEEAYDSFKVIFKAKNFLMRNRNPPRSLSSERRNEVQIRVLVTSFYLQ